MEQFRKGRIKLWLRKRQRICSILMQSSLNVEISYVRHVIQVLFFEKRGMMLTLVFLRFIGEKYEDGIEKLRQTLIEQGLNPDDENIHAAFFDDVTFTDGTYNL